jgi:hypothetical protein
MRLSLCLLRKSPSIIYTWDRGLESAKIEVDGMLVFYMRGCVDVVHIYSATQVGACLPTIVSS